MRIAFCAQVISPHGLARSSIHIKPIKENEGKDGSPHPFPFPLFLAGGLLGPRASDSFAFLGRPPLRLLVSLFCHEVAVPIPVARAGLGLVVEVVRL